MVWCGVVWYGILWCGMVWYGVVWCRPRVVFAPLIFVWRSLRSLRIPYHTTEYPTIPPYTKPHHKPPIPSHAHRNSGPIAPYKIAGALVGGRFRQTAISHTTPNHQTTLNHTKPHHTIPYHPIPHHTTPYHTIPYDIV